MWLGSTRGYFSDWITQRWVQATGRRVDFSRELWLRGPVGRTLGIGENFAQELAEQHDLEVCTRANSGLIDKFAELKSNSFHPHRVDPRVADFYERTGSYEIDAWAQWNGVFRPFGGLLALLFSRRLQQLNVPLSGLDTSRGITNEVIQLVDPKTKQLAYTVWLRRLVGTGRVLYAGCYSLCRVPGVTGLCVKVVFPLPNGNATVLMRPEAHDDGSFSLISSGRAFGDPGFYFTVYGTEKSGWARYVRSMREIIHVYPESPDVVRADHDLTIWGLRFLQIHYRLQTKHTQAA